MEFSALLIGLRLALGLFEMNSALASSDSDDRIKQMADYTQAGAATTVEALCNLQDAPRRPAFSMDGDYIIGGVFSIHYNMQVVMHNYTTKPEPLRCTGRLVGVERWEMEICMMW